LEEIIAYEGSSFTIEWFYDEQGKSEVLDYFKELDDINKRKVMMLFKRMGDFGRISDITKFRNEGDKIFAFKPQPHRFLSFFFAGKKIIVTNAFCKKSQKLPDEEKQKALSRKENYEQRVTSETYYAKI